MPKFLAGFTEILNKSKDNFLAKLQHTMHKDLEKAYNLELVKVWNSVPPNEEMNNLKICAVDGSNQVRELANGTKIYVARALGITNYGIEFQNLQANVIEFRGIKSSQFQNFIVYKMEFAELQVVKQFLDSAPDKDEKNQWICFLDGSWYGRIMNQVMEFRLDEEQAFLIDYHKLLQDVFRIAREKKIWLVGVSKDSDSNVLRNILLQKIGKNLLATSALSVSEKATLQNAFLDCEQLKPQIVTSLQSTNSMLEKSYGLQFAPLKAALEERMFRSLSDYALVLKCQPGTGYSVPVEVGPSRQNRLKYFSKLTGSGVQSFAESAFRHYLSSNIQNKTKFLQDVVKVFEGITQYPTMVTFVMLLHERDLPLRIDFPLSMLGQGNSIANFKGNTPLLDSKCLAFTEQMVKMYLNFYAGLKDYHVFLKRVDELVKLSNKTMDQIYERLLEKELNTTLIHTRDYRRVSGI